MAKSPFELRTELLNMSMTVLMAQHSAEHAKNMQQEYLANPDVRDFGVPTAPSIEDVVAEATKLNQFIQTK